MHCCAHIFKYMVARKTELDGILLPSTHFVVEFYKSAASLRWMWIVCMFCVCHQLSRDETVADERLGRVASHCHSRHRRWCVAFYVEAMWRTSRTVQCIRPAMTLTTSTMVVPSSTVESLKMLSFHWNRAQQQQKTSQKMFCKNEILI